MAGRIEDYAIPARADGLNLEGHAEAHRRGPWDERRNVPGYEDSVP